MRGIREYRGGAFPATSSILKKSLDSDWINALRLGG
jgi:hypothetical protein